MASQVARAVSDLPAMLWIAGLGGPPGEGSGSPLQCSCLGNPADRGAWRAVVNRVTQSRRQLTERAHTEARKPLQEGGEHPFLVV